ncbi:g7715 [Coccomyxa elongata]
MGFSAASLQKISCPANATRVAANGGTSLKLSAEEEALFMEEDDEDDGLDDEELDALEARMSAAAVK